MDQRSARQQYKKISILTASAEEIVISLHKEALLSIEAAQTFIENEDLPLQNESLKKAQEYVLELITFVNPEAQNGKELIAVYEYLNKQLVRANVKKDLHLLQEVYGLLTTMQEDWQVALQKRRKKYRGSLI